MFDGWELKKILRPRKDEETGQYRRVYTAQQIFVGRSIQGV
jgi:hypothetical protein